MSHGLVSRKVTEQTIYTFCRLWSYVLLSIAYYTPLIDYSWTQMLRDD